MQYGEGEQVASQDHYQGSHTAWRVGWWLSIACFPFPRFFLFHSSLFLSRHPSLSPILYDPHIQQLLFLSAANSADNLLQFDIHPSISSKGILLFALLCPRILYHCTMCSPSFCISSNFKGHYYTVYLFCCAHSK